MGDDSICSYVPEVAEKMKKYGMPLREDKKIGPDDEWSFCSMKMDSKGYSPVLGLKAFRNIMDKAGTVSKEEIVQFQTYIKGAPNVKLMYKALAGALTATGNYGSLPVICEFMTSPSYETCHEPTPWIPTAQNEEKSQAPQQAANQG